MSLSRARRYLSTAIKNHLDLVLYTKRMSAIRHSASLARRALVSIGTKFLIAVGFVMLLFAAPLRIFNHTPLSPLGGRAHADVPGACASCSNGGDDSGSSSYGGPSGNCSCSGGDSGCMGGSCNGEGSCGCGCGSGDSAGGSSG